MAPVQQLGEVSWSVGCAACCHMALVFAVMHLYIFFLLLLSIPLFLYLKKSGNLVLINRRNGPRYQRVLALCAFSTGVIPKGLFLRKKNVVVDVCVCFVLCNFVSGQILWFWDNLWFDDLHA